MKTTVDLPDPIFRRAKATAAHRGITLKAFITSAVESNLEKPKMTVSELLDSLPQLPYKIFDQVNASVAEMDAKDLQLQAEEPPKDKSK